MTPLEQLASLTDSAWLVGGAVRDRLLGRSTGDYDVTITGDPHTLATALARSADGFVFKLSQDFGVWRVLARDRSWQVDLLPLVGERIESDLAERDFTINAIAQPLADGDYVDPFGGLEDLRSGRLRMVSASAFLDDPLRTLRLARLACELRFAVDEETATAAAASAAGLEHVAPERVFVELARIVSSDDAVEGMELLDSLGATGVVLPELAGLHGIEQSAYHHLDVYEHTKAVLGETIALEREPERWLGEHATAVRSLLAEPLGNELSRGQALRFGALFHDVAKPRTRDVTAEGRVTFIGHDAAGAEMARAALTRLRAGERLREYVAGLARHHLRLGFLVHETPLSRRAIYRYMHACEPVQIDVTLLSVADRLATRGKGSERAIERHLELARQLVGEGLVWRDRRPQPPLRGDDLARAVGARGPEIGRILRELEEASYAGEISTREDAIDRARELLRAGS